MTESRRSGTKVEKKGNFEEGKLHRQIKKQPAYDSKLAI